MKKLAHRGKGRFRYTAAVQGVMRSWAMAPRYRLPASALRNAAAALQQGDSTEMSYRMAELRTLGIMLTSDPGFRRQFRGVANGNSIEVEDAFDGLCAWMETMRTALTRRGARPR